MSGKTPGQVGYAAYCRRFVEMLNEPVQPGESRDERFTQAWEAAAQAVLDASPVVRAARACVYGYSDRTPDGGGVHIGPFDPDTCRSLHDAVVAMDGGEDE